MCKRERSANKLRLQGVVEVKELDQAERVESVDRVSSATEEGVESGCETDLVSSVTEARKAVVE